MKTIKGLATDNLTIGYDSDIITGISLSVAPGKIVTLIGPNGSGKSTLLKTVTYQLKSRGGVILIDGTDREALSTKDIATKLSMVMTASVNPDLMTCREVIESGRYPYTGLFGKLSEEDRSKVDEAIAATQTKEVADRLFTNISDGQRQRVWLARAIAQEPDVLVLDEPTSYLDIKYKTDILTKIRDLTKNRNIAVLMSVHEPEIAMKLSDTVIAVSDGKVQRIGTPEEVFEETFIRRLYGLGDMSTELMGVTPWLNMELPIGENNFIGSTDNQHSLRECRRVRIATQSGHIMIQGTMSNVGKSIITAGLCRIFAQDGYRVAPFKSQNMANNSYVTADGLEMGRAQVMQAECCKVSPDVSMNPILLKPTDDCGSQVIVNGRPVGNMRAAEYFEYKKQLVPVIKDAFDKLRSEYDIVVIEGAGSPAEINLKDGDIVNMGLAKLTDSPVFLVGDIDRGGVFAQLLGTLDLLEEDERSRVCGLIVNKFRGDVKLLEPGIKMIEERACCRVTGVVPYMDIKFDDEDSLSGRFSHSIRKAFDIAVIRLPHIANFTDLDVFDQAENVSVRYVDEPVQLAGADIIVIPGTKNTIGDMRRIRESKMADAICEAAAKGTAVIGICGGYQMLGTKISDPEGAEGGGSTGGLGLLPVETVLSSDKTRKLFEGVCEEPTGILADIKDSTVRGYEIHMGNTKCLEMLSPFTSGGTGYCRGNVYGTYVHGLFDTKQMAAGIVEAVAKAHGTDIDVSHITDHREYKEKQYDMLADVLRESLDIHAIYRAMGLAGPESERTGDDNG